MRREDWLLQGIGKADLGIEIAPWLAPIAAKRDGYNVRILDIFDRPTLMARAAADPNEKRGPERLEEVDFVGSATDLAGLVPADLHGAVAYVLSSHNFEHLPDPIRFLQGCESVLAPGGILAMAVPDRRACFDCFRPHTVIGDWIEAHAEGRRQPNGRQVFEMWGRFAERRDGEGVKLSFRLGTPLEALHCAGDLKKSWAAWQAGEADGAYQDSHCTVMTPASLELLLAEARLLGLIGLEIVEITRTHGGEFFVRLRRPESGEASAEADVTALRSRLSREIIREYAAQAAGEGALRASVRPLARKVRAMGRRLRGK